jgi:hypothetical protein
MEDKRAYFVGTLPNSPFQNITLGGVCFPQFTSDITFGKESNIASQNRHNGDVLQLDGEEIDRIKNAAKRKVVRWNANSSRAFLAEKDERYRPMSSDKPIGEYVYLISVQDASKWDANWRDKHPKHSLAFMMAAEERAAKAVRPIPPPEPVVASPEPAESDSTVAKEKKSKGKKK